MLATKMKAYNRKLIEQGIEQGFEKGIEQEKRTIITKMHNQHFPLEKMAELTDLTVDEVRKYLEK